MLTVAATTRTREIEMALCANLATLKEGLFDFLAALVLLLIGFCSVAHAVLRLVFAVLGLVLWVVALLVVFLYWLRAWAVARSSSSLHKEL